MITKLAQLPHCLGNAKFFVPRFPLALVQFPWSLVPAITEKPDDIAALVVRGADPQNVDEFSGLAIKPLLDEFFELCVSNFLQPNGKADHRLIRTEFPSAHGCPES